MYLEKAILTKQELDTLKPIDTGLEERVMQKMRLDWNYHSNSIEGNSLTYGETKSLIMHHITADGKPLRDHFEITGHNDALLWVIDLVKGDRAITENFIRELHKLILKENFLKPAITPTGEKTTKEIKVGEYKTQSNHVETITGEIFYFAEPHEVKAKMTDLIDWYNEKEKEGTNNPIVFAAEFHYKFIRIHPFGDGNGRIARILMNFILMKYGYHPAIIKKETKEEYYKVLRLADANNIEPFIEFIAESVNESLTLMLNGIKGLPFEDDNDIDKQFWLLDQKINVLSSNINKFKSPEIINKIINHNIVDLYKELVLQSEKFVDYYISISSAIYYSNDNKVGRLTKKENGFKKIDLSNLKIISEATVLRLQFMFFDFNRKGVIPFFHSQSLTINFENLFYEIFDPPVIIRKSYDEEITNEEIKAIINKITQDHIKYIEQQLSNSTNHNPTIL